MKTRKIELKDLKNVAKLFNSYRVFYEKESDVKAAEKFLTERFQNKESEVFVAENDQNELVGFVQLYPIFSSTRMKKLWLLNDLFVDENSRGQGISVLLMNDAKDLCQSTDAYGLILETAKSNFIGNKLYPKMGFALDEDHHFYSWDRQ